MICLHVLRLQNILSMLCSVSSFQTLLSLSIMTIPHLIVLVVPVQNIYHSLCSEYNSEITKTSGPKRFFHNYRAVEKVKIKGSKN